MASSGKEFDFDLENGGKEVVPNKRPAKQKVSTRSMSSFLSLDQSKSTSVKSIEVLNEKQKMNAARKAQKPPRPPNGPTLDAADLRFIREVLADIAPKKRAKIQRIKQAKKIEEAAQKSSSGGPSNSTIIIFAMNTTLFFFLIMYFLG